MNCIKLLAHSLMARDFDRQVAELQVRIAALHSHQSLSCAGELSPRNSFMVDDVSCGYALISNATLES